MALVDESGPERMGGELRTSYEDVTFCRVFEPAHSFRVEVALDPSRLPGCVNPRRGGRPTPSSATGRHAPWWGELTAAAHPLEPSARLGVEQLGEAAMPGLPVLDRLQIGDEVARADLLHCLT